MTKLKLYIYPQIHHHNCPIQEYEVPFSDRGIAEHCELVGPTEADFFYCGQFENTNRWLLDSRRFEYFVGNEHRHIFDLESDLDDKIQPWIPLEFRQSIFTAMNALPEHRDWNVMVRPGFSRLLVDLVKREPQPWKPPIRTGFYFRGQRDPHGLREKVRQALILADVPHDFTFTDRWNAPTAAHDPIVRSFERETLEWSHSLCPGGTGMSMTCRYFEVMAFGRVPVVIAKNYLFGERCGELSSWLSQLGPDTSVEQLARWLQWSLEKVPTEHGKTFREFFDYHTKVYFADPTLYFIEWMQSRGLL